MKGTIFAGMDSLAHGWQVLSSLLIAGSVTAVAYALSSAGLAEVAGTALSFYCVFIFTKLFSKMAGRKRQGHFKGSTAFIKQFKDDLDLWMQDRSVLALFVVAVPITIAYIAFRSACIAVLGVFGNIWFAIAAGLLLGALVASPILFRDIGRLITRDSGSVDLNDHDEPVSAQTPLEQAQALKGDLDRESARLEGGNALLAPQREV